MGCGASSKSVTGADPPTVDATKFVGIHDYCLQEPQNDDGSADLPPSPNTREKPDSADPLLPSQPALEPKPNDRANLAPSEQPESPSRITVASSANNNKNICTPTATSKQDPTAEGIKPAGKPPTAPPRRNSASAPLLQVFSPLELGFSGTTGGTLNTSSSRRGADPDCSPNQSKAGSHASQNTAHHAAAMKLSSSQFTVQKVSSMNSSVSSSTTPRTNQLLPSKIGPLRPPEGVTIGGGTFSGIPMVHGNSSSGSFTTSSQPELTNRSFPPGVHRPPRRQNPLASPRSGSVGKGDRDVTPRNQPQSRLSTVDALPNVTNAPRASLPRCGDSFFRHVKICRWIDGRETMPPPPFVMCEDVHDDLVPEITETYIPLQRCSNEDLRKNHLLCREREYRIIALRRRQPQRTNKSTPGR